MDRAILKTLENCLKEKVGQTVQSLDIISQEFIVVLVTGLKTLTNFDVVKWVQVTKLPVKYHAMPLTDNYHLKPRPENFANCLKTLAGVLYQT